MEVQWSYGKPLTDVMCYYRSRTFKGTVHLECQNTFCLLVVVIFPFLDSYNVNSACDAQSTEKSIQKTLSFFHFPNADVQFCQSEKHKDNWMYFVFVDLRCRLWTWSRRTTTRGQRSTWQQLKVTNKQTVDVCWPHSVCSPMGEGHGRRPRGLDKSNVHSDSWLIWLDLRLKVDVTVSSCQHNMSRMHSRIHIQSSKVTVTSDIVRWENTGIREKQASLYLHKQAFVL